MNLDSLRHLQAAMSRIDGLVHEAVTRAQAAGRDPTDALRGLIISEDEVQAHLSSEGLAGLWAGGDSPLALAPIEPDLPFARMARIFNLSLLDSYILLLVLAPELDRRYERLYAYLQDDVSQRRPTVNLVMNMLGHDVPARFAVWERLKPEMPLRTHHLIECLPNPNQYEPVFISYQLKVDHRILAYLLGDDAMDARLDDTTRLAVADLPPTLPDSVLEPIYRALANAPMVYMQGPEGSGRRATAAALCQPLVQVDLTRLQTLPIGFERAWELAVREARLIGAGLLLYEWESCLEENGQPPARLWETLLNFERPIFLCGQATWEPHDVNRPRRLLRLNFAVPPKPERQRLWAQYVDSVDPALLDELAGKFRFTPGQIARAVNTAADLATSRGETITMNDLYAGAQAHSSLRLGDMARRIIPRYDWDDLVLPPDQIAQLREIRERAEYAYRVQDEWGYGHKVAPNAGVSALFAGESGTGKTMSAEVIARDLGLVLYKIDLSSVVSKYIGETEKNLSVIFEEAQASNAILFFDEADALFGKRSEVKDAHDRYANIEIAYLLQRIETYDGIAILATNLRQNLDEAFTRRLDFVIDYPFPDTEYRYHIWMRHFPPQAPLAPDVDLNLVAERYRLAGGNIRNAALASAYLAAADGGVITMNHIRHAIRREHQKMGRLLVDE
ncbi:MAG TPA: ATP-binding protein [Spirillospora sp.]|nr:ATP-binding protein [Spirillospora sp.]